MNNNPTSRKRKSDEASSQNNNVIMIRDTTDEAQPEAEAEDSNTITCHRCQHTVPECNRIVHEVNCARRVRVNEDFFDRVTTTTDGAPDSNHSELQNEQTRHNMMAMSESDASIPVASGVDGSIRPPAASGQSLGQSRFPSALRSRPDSELRGEESSYDNTVSMHHPNMAIARSLADVMVDDAAATATDGENNNVSGRHPYSLGYQDVPLVNPRHDVTSTTNPVPAAAVAASTTSNHSEEAEWACPRCTLLNPSNMIHCDACLFPRNRHNHFLPRPRHRLIGDPFVSDMLHDSEEEEGWVNISRMDRTTTPTPITTTATTPNRNRDNGWIISDTPDQPLSMGYRIFNSALNGAMVGSILAGVSGLIIGGLAGGIGGAWVSHVRHREADRDMNEAEEALLFRDAAEGGDGSNTNTPMTSRNGVRVHRGRNYLIAVRSDGNGRRILRLRYNGTGRQPSPSVGGTSTTTTSNGPNNNNNNDAEMEQALSELLLRMSYMHGLGRHGNIVIQPNLSYEELLERYGMGDENRRGASEEIINSYPVEVIGNNDDDKSVVKKDEDDENQSLKLDETSNVPIKSDKVDYGTCGICLEDYQKGEDKKSLSCPHSFHKECIDRWLKQVASCPICKKEVEMYQAKKMERE